MNTPAILNPIAAPQGQVPAAKQTGASASDVSFNQVLSREVAERSNSSETNRAARQETSNASVPSQPSQKTANKKSEKDAASGNGDAAQSDSAATAAIASTIPMDMLSLVANIAQLNGGKLDISTASDSKASADITLASRAIRPAGKGKIDLAALADTVSKGKDDLTALADSASKDKDDLAELTDLPSKGKREVTAFTESTGTAKDGPTALADSGNTGDGSLAGPASIANANLTVPTDSASKGKGDLAALANSIGAAKPGVAAGADVAKPATDGKATGIKADADTGKDFTAEMKATGEPKQPLEFAAVKPQESRPEITAPALPAAHIEAAKATEIQTMPALAALQQATVNGTQSMERQPVDKLTPPVGTPAWDQALGQKVVWMVAGAQQSASLTLNPPDLGPLQVVLNVSNSQANATFIAAQPEVRQALEAAMPKLREMMGDAGIQLGQATVSAGTPNQNGGFAEQSHKPSQSGNQPGETSIDEPIRASRGRTISSGQGLVDTFV